MSEAMANAGLIQDGIIPSLNEYDKELKKGRREGNQFSSSSSSSILPPSSPLRKPPIGDIIW